MLEKVKISYNNLRNEYEKIYREYKENKTIRSRVYIFLRFLVILTAIYEVFRGHFQNAFLCFIALLLLLMPSTISRALKLKIPPTTEILLYLFIFASLILGEINDFYGKVPHWDTLLHIVNGFLAAAVGFSIVDIFSSTSENIKLSPGYICIVAFCFSMTIGVLWEFYEYGADKYFQMDMQKDVIIQDINSVHISEEANVVKKIKDIETTVIYNSEGEILEVIEGGYLDIGLNDTIKDLLVNFIGALMFSILGYFELVNKEINKELEEKEIKRKSILTMFVPISERRILRENQRKNKKIVKTFKKEIKEEIKEEIKFNNKEDKVKKQKK